MVQSICQQLNKLLYISSSTTLLPHLQPPLFYVTFSLTFYQQATKYFITNLQFMSNTTHDSFTEDISITSKFLLTEMTWLYDKTLHEIARIKKLILNSSVMI